MAQFTPGHLHIERHALNKDDHSYNFCVDYETVQDPTAGKGIQFRLHGTIQDKPADETFFLGKSDWYNFAAVIDDIARKHDMPIKGIVTSAHNTLYDRMFEDIRDKLEVKSGDPIKPERFE
ncbi:DUF5064 family protein [Pseudomonas putida CSV86]|uniref:Acetyl-CoA carboxylase n=2 Tax=Pseudomonas TaxID=286 RepID=A0A177SU81_PSEPU|nr:MULTISPECIES: DUF5064 family protein [Pseudomonas]MDG9882093.1 DUF5064 family protein [Pseudomonas sp. GD04058]NNJ17302.1 DUF5064 family protein [Pseudomonas bharatica CSV86]OAI94359.1 acetyl-CoA carboxylase [Pseudomonas putida]